MNKISPPYGVPLQSFGNGHPMRQDCAYRRLISPPAFSAQNNKGNKGERFFHPLKTFFSLLLSLVLTGCSNEPKLPEPPISFPFLAWKAGEKLDFQFRVKKKEYYKFSINVYYKERAKDDYEDMERIRKLVGDYERNSAGKIDRIGIPIPLKLKVIQENGGQEKVVVDGKFHELENYGHGVKHFSKKIIFIVLEPGDYRCQLESLSDIPEFVGTEMKFSLAKHHAK